MSSQVHALRTLCVIVLVATSCACARRKQPKPPLEVDFESNIFALFKNERRYGRNGYKWRKGYVPKSAYPRSYSAQFCHSKEMTLVTAETVEKHPGAVDEMTDIMQKVDYRSNKAWLAGEHDEGQVLDAFSGDVVQRDPIGKPESCMKACGRCIQPRCWYDVGFIICEKPMDVTDKLCYTNTGNLRNFEVSWKMTTPQNMGQSLQVIEKGKDGIYLNPGGRIKLGGAVFKHLSSSDDKVEAGESITLTISLRRGAFLNIAAIYEDDSKEVWWRYKLLNEQRGDCQGPWTFSSIFTDIHFK